MKKIYVLLLLTSSFSSIYAQQTFYQKTVTSKKQPVAWTGGAPYIAKQTVDRGLIFCGIYDAGSGNNNMFLKKTDSNYVTQWSFGLYINTGTTPYSLVQTKNQGYVVVGSYADAPGESAAFILRFTSAGKLAWQKYYKKEMLTAAYSVSEDKSGNIFVTGKSDAGSTSGYWVTKLAANGDVLLNKVYELTGYNTYETQVISTTAKGFAVLGSAGANSFVMKADSLGVPKWTKLIKEDITAFRTDISESKNKELTIAATRTSDVLAFKLDKNGNTKWSKLISNAGNVDLNDIYQLSSAGNFLVSATVKTAPAEMDILKLDNATGSVIAAKTLKTTTGNTFSFLNKKSETEYTVTGWDASAGTNYINVINLDSSLTNCSDNATVFAASDYTFADSAAASDSIATLDVLTATATSVSWVNITTGIDTVCSEVVLPLNLIRFTLSKNGSSNVLSWSTAQEINTSYFEIQRSTDSRTFTAIGKVTAAGKATQNDYQFTDASPLNGINYYRLKIADADGKFTYSAYVWLSNTGNADIIIYPNPVKNRIVVKINSLIKTTYNISVTDMQGRVVLISSVNVAEGATSKDIDAAALKQGTYFVKIESAENSQVIKIVK